MLVTVVWTPFLVDSLISPTLKFNCENNRLRRVDLPTPDWPQNKVILFGNIFFNFSIPMLVTALVTKTGYPISSYKSAQFFISSLVIRSDLLIAITELMCALSEVIKNLSKVLLLNSGWWTLLITTIWSIFAAIICSRRSPRKLAPLTFGDLREI